jgi:hypothetical protein
MSETTPPQTLEESIATTGRRYFRIAEAAYAALCEDFDTRRGYPTPSGDTLRFFPLPVDSTRAENDDILISVETWRIDEADETAIQAAITSDDATELTHEAFAELLPPPPEDPFA